MGLSQGHSTISTLIHRKDPILGAQDSKNPHKLLASVAENTGEFSCAKPAGPYILYILPPESYFATAATKLMQGFPLQCSLHCSG